MNCNSINTKISDPFYYHHEYKNDILKLERKHDEKTWVDNAQRFGLVALPFISLYKPLSLPLSLSTGGLRVLSCSLQLRVALQQGEKKEIAYQALQTAIAVSALAGTVFAHPVGMLITTTHDILIELSHMLDNLKEGKYEAAVLNYVNIVNNALYFALFVHGGLEIAIASLATQVVIGLYHSHDEFKKGNNLEAAGHILMALIRSNQLRLKLDAVNATRTSMTLMSVDREKSIDPENTTLISTQKVEVINFGDEKLHLADYGDSRSVMTFLEGPNKGWQHVYYRGGSVELKSRKVEWHRDYFIHFYPESRIITYSDRQITEFYDF